MYTGRDAIHKYLSEHDDAPVDLNGQIIYHCGPVMLKDEEGKWHVKAAGPTTSIREEPYQGDIMKDSVFVLLLVKAEWVQKHLLH